MKVSDYIVDFLASKGITDVFGYPGGSVTNLMESFRVNRNSIEAHVVYHEQAAAFAACAYAQVTGNVGVAYATGGPGATNMLTGIGHAFYDSIPTIFLTGNVNTYERHGDLPIRQKGFQESDIISVASPLTKAALVVDKPEDVRFILEKAYYIATSGRKGPVLIDLPMDVQRGEVNPEFLKGYECVPDENIDNIDSIKKILYSYLQESERPVFLLGNGIKVSNKRKITKDVIDRVQIPCVTSMLAFDIFNSNERYYYGFVGAYGHRAANFVLAKSDLVIALGSRMDIRQVGAKRENFAPGSKLIRVDLDKGELSYKVHEDEVDICADLGEVLNALMEISVKNYDGWNKTCSDIRNELDGLDNQLPNLFVEKISDCIPKDTIITTDVGQNQVWVAQSLIVKDGQEVLFSGGMGAMGYALPAAIGAAYANRDKIITCICGDGGLQMNIQELQYLVREQLPVKVIVFNNNALGMIRHFQEMYFNNISYQTKKGWGYDTPEFYKIAKAYGIDSCRINKPEQLEELQDIFLNKRPALIEICIDEDTYIVPKLEYGKPNQDQTPLIDRDLYNKLMEL